jgi:hypothetical protein
MTLGGKVHYTADHLPMRVARKFSGARHTGFGTDIGIGINVKDIKNTVPKSDVKPGIVAAAGGLVCQNTSLL